MKELWARLTGKESPIGRGEGVRHIGDYTVVRKIGSGGTSDVYLGLHVKTMATAAIKQLGLKRSAPAHQQMFVTESLLCGILDHPNVINMYGSSFSDPDGAYLVMEYIDGCSLDRHDSPGTLLPLEKVVDIMRQAAEALRYLAGEGVIHRDIKPGNLLLRKDGRVKIADFGCAILNGQPPSSLGVAGSLPYMSPEQIAGKLLCHLSDMYSLGAVFYRLLTGRHPIEVEEGEQPPSYARRILEIPPMPMAHYRKDIPAGITGVVDRLLCKNPAERYESWQAFQQALYRSSADQYREDEGLAEQWRSFEIHHQNQFTAHDYNLSFGF